MQRRLLTALPFFFSFFSFTVAFISHIPLNLTDFEAARAEFECWAGFGLGLGGLRMEFRLGIELRLLRDGHGIWIRVRISIWGGGGGNRICFQIKGFQYDDWITLEDLDPSYRWPVASSISSVLSPKTQPISLDICYPSHESAQNFASTAIDEKNMIVPS